MKMVVGTTFCVRKMCKINTQNKAKPESINPKLFSLLGGGGGAHKNSRSWSLIVYRIC